MDAKEASDQAKQLTELAAALRELAQAVRAIDPADFVGVLAPAEVRHAKRLADAVLG